MKLIETTVSETTVRMRYADNADAAKATQWVDIQVPIAGLVRGSGTPLSDPSGLKLSITQATVLHAVQDLIGVEMSRLANLANRSS